MFLKQRAVSFERSAITLIDNAATLDDDSSIGDTQNYLRFCSTRIAEMPSS
jgi:hypothetical protein